MRPYNGSKPTEKETNKTQNTIKKTIITISIILGLGLAVGATAQGGGLFQRGYQTESSRGGSDLTPMLPLGHNMEGDQDASEESPLAGGMALMFGLGVLYLTRKRRSES